LTKFKDHGKKETIISVFVVYCEIFILFYFFVLFFLCSKLLNHSILNSHVFLLAFVIFLIIILKCDKSIKDQISFEKNMNNGLCLPYTESLLLDNVFITRFNLSLGKITLDSKVR